MSPSQYVYHCDHVLKRSPPIVTSPYQGCTKTQDIVVLLKRPSYCLCYLHIGLDTDEYLCWTADDVAMVFTDAYGSSGSFSSIVIGLLLLLSEFAT